MTTKVPSPKPSPRSSNKPPKQFVIDTNVLLHDPASLFHFADNAVWLPVEVLEELDKFKQETSTRGANAREVHRKLSERFRNAADMERGVKLENGGSLHVTLGLAGLHEDGGGFAPALSHSSSPPGPARAHEPSPRLKLLRRLFPDASSVDNRILAAAVRVADSHSGTAAVLVTKDMNMQLKARALGLDAQDYRNDRVEDSDIRRTQRATTLEEYRTIPLAGSALQAFASRGHIRPGGKIDLLPNEYALLSNASDPAHGIPARHVRDDDFHRLRADRIRIRGGNTFHAANLGQRFFLDALFDPEISLVTVYGKAGTGKTLLSVGAALEQVQADIYQKMLITRVIMPTGRDIGFLPGRMEEKMQPWVQPACDALEQLLSIPSKPHHFEGKKHSARKKHRNAATAAAGAMASPSAVEGMDGGARRTADRRRARPYEALLENGMVEIEAIAHIRGRSIPNAIFIVDEAQQLTPHEAKTLVTRMGKGSKLVLIGDLAQIDNPYVDAHTNGLVFTRNRMQGQSFMAHVNLFRGERSEMAEIAADLM